MSTDVTSFDMPTPAGVRTPADFVSTMRAMRDWAALTYGELAGIAQANGDRLPQSTIASALTRESLPRETTVAAFVRACGGDPDTVQAWLAARKRVASAGADGNLARAVEAWLVSRRKPQRETSRPRAQAPLVTQHYAQGRLAKLAEQSNSDRWRGVHRRKNPYLLRLRRLASYLSQSGHS